MKRTQMVLLAIFILISGVLSGPSQTAHAASNSDDRYTYRTGAWFEDGDLHYVTKNAKATTDTTYGTKALIFRVDITCNPDKNPLTAECSPLSGGSDNYLRIDLYKPTGERDTSIWTVRDVGECDYLAEVMRKDGEEIEAQKLWDLKKCKQREYGSKPEDSILVAVFISNAGVMTDKIAGHNNPKFQNIRDGGDIYISPVFIVKYKGVPAFTPEYATLDGIRDAKSWGNKSYFRDYYDAKVVYHGSFPLYVEFLNANTRDELKPKIQVQSQYGPEDIDGYKKGQWPAWKYTKAMTLDGKGVDMKLPTTIDDGHGKTYVLRCSYITRLKKYDEKKCSDSGDDPYWVRGPELTERNPPVYIGGTVVVALYDSDCKCHTTATIPNKGKLEGEVPAENAVIGQKVTMQVDLQQTPEELEDWKQWVKGKTDFKIRIRTYRSDQTDKMTGLANTGAKAIWSKGSVLLPATDANPNYENDVGTTPWVLLAYLDGGNDSKVLFQDDLTNYPIPEGGKVSFRYNADVFISAKDTITNTIVTKQCTRPGPSTEMTWFRPPKPKPDIGNFVSIPKNFSEIKEGSPQLSGTSSNETFDAMSGTPTTRSLYFAAGGSEFIVDVQVEYVPKVTQTRTYKSEFTKVVNGWAMERILPSYQEDTEPPKPAARTVTDACGAPFTEEVLPRNRPYLQGYTEGDDPQPIYGTEYGWEQMGHDFEMVGGYVDSWTQTVTFDYMKINKAVVWRIDRSKVNGMSALVGTNEVTASIHKINPNDPNDPSLPTVFSNFAKKDTSKDGRLRYSVEPAQHDAVYWYEGESDNCLTNSKTSGTVDEQKQFDIRRNTEGNVTAVSDFLILQTSSGDQSVMYFEKSSDPAATTEQLDVPVTDFDTMWTNNPLSAAKWDQLNTIKVGSYNGNYGNPTNKYSGASTSTVATVFDTLSAGLIRPHRPLPYLRLMHTGIDVPDALPNGEYFTGVSEVFYQLALIHNDQNLPVMYGTGYNNDYQANGQAFPAPYSPIHAKVNDVVIHDPVSVENALVVSLPSSLDQRTPASQAIGGNKQEGVAEYERVLDPSYRQNIIPNSDAEIVNVNGTVAGWNQWVASGSSANMTFTNRSGDTWVIGPGKHTFEVNSAAGTGATGGYWKDIPIKPNTNYRFEGDLSCHRCDGYFALDVYTSDMQYTGVSAGSSDHNTTSVLQHKTFDFTSPANAGVLRIHMIKGPTLDAVSNPRDYLFADNLLLKNMSVQEFVAVDPVFVTEEVPNPDYVKATNGTNKTFTYTGSAETFIAPDDGVYTIEAWGAQGGRGTQKGSSGSGGLGGYSRGQITLSKGETLNMYVGGQGGSSGAAGWNGGGSATSSNGGGGGASDVRKGGTELKDRILVAGGGGGGGSGATGGDGGGEKGGTGTSTSEVSGGAGGSQTSGYSLGSGGSVSGDASAGGGGYYGGYGAASHGCSNPNAGGGGGSGYVGGVSNGTMSTGVNTGDGQIVITSPPRAAIGAPTKVVTTMAGGSDTSPPSDAYVLQTITVKPSTPAGGYTPGNFVLLDHGFQLYFPNTGDFYGNGQWGWSQTTEIRGKGFTDGMDTTEWTQAKYVKFDFNVIYNGVMYKANEWISLDVGTTLFDFYVPLANRERVSAMVEWKSVAINAAGEDSDLPTNKVRYNTPRTYAAKHSTLKKYQVDVVGRIGNMVIEDTGDFRFSNLFKQQRQPTEWLIPNVVAKVNPNTQAQVIGDLIDIRGESMSTNASYLNTWGLLTHLNLGNQRDNKTITFPLSPEKNNIKALQNQPLRLGYDVLSDIQTMGNYYSNLQIIPYYYHLNLQNGAITPVDIYMNVDGDYKIINRHNGGSTATVYENPVWLNWDDQAGRRNVTAAEQEWTSRIAALFAQSGGDSEEPSGNYLYGTSQFMQLTGRNRTYIGQDATYGWDKNPGNKLSMMEYAMQAQRWHFSYSLPSSAVAVRAGQQVTQANIDALRANTGVLVLAADIKAVGDTYTLQYTAPMGNGTVNIAGTSWPLGSIPYPVIAIYSASKSSADDLQVSGTH